MSQAEHPDRSLAQHEVTVEDVRQLMGASTPHFALQLRNRIAHGYGTVDVARIWSELPSGIIAFEAFAGAIAAQSCS